MIQLLCGVKHLHDNWILHRDLKTSNLLLSHAGILKVSAAPGELQPRVSAAPGARSQPHCPCRWGTSGWHASMGLL